VPLLPGSSRGSAYHLRSVCAQTAIDNSGAPPPQAPRRGSQITPIQWVGLAALLALIAYQAGLLNGPGGISGYLQDVAPRLIALLLAITIHEFSHGLVATWFGDSTPRRAGRLTLNPIKHLDPIGTILILIRAPIGWGKPMPINPGEMRNSNLGWALSSLAGPVSNILMAGVVLAFLRYVLTSSADPTVARIVVQLVQINVFLAVFNLLPIPPLDGFGVVFGLAPRPLKVALLPVFRYGPLILLVVLFLPQTQQYLSLYLGAGAQIILRFLGVLVGGL
jgi:Zn-dependent protease